MAEIINVFKELMPDVKLIGKRYSNEDRDSFGSFSSKWGEWFQNGYFEKLKQCEGIEKISDDYVGAMRCVDGRFEYWIGIFMSPNDEAPEDFEAINIDSSQLGVCYVYGNENNGDIYGMEVHNACMEKFKEQNWIVSENNWFVERYNCPRFTTPDEKGNVILDYCAYLG